MTSFNQNYEHLLEEFGQEQALFFLIASTELSIILQMDFRQDEVA